jgi:predicted MFS family arabinose efflux permease
LSTDANGRRGWLPRHGLWRHRDFLLLWSAQGVSAVGSRITRTALPMAAILVAGAGALDLGLLAVALTLPRALFAWLGGGWVDRHRRRPVLIGTDVVRAVALLAIPVAAWSHLLSMPLLYAIAAITGVATVLFDLADHVFITDLVGRDQLLDANGKREAVDAVAEISGPALGGALVAWLTAPIAIAADALTFVASALLIVRIRKVEKIVAPPAAASLLADARIGIHVVWRDPAVRALFIASATMTLFGSFMASLYTLFALRDLALTPTELGIAIGCGGIGALAGAMASRRAAERFGPRRTLIGSLALGAAMQVLIPLAPPIPWIAMMFLIATQLIGDGVLTVYLINETTLRQRLLPPEALGRAAGTFQVANGLLTPIGALVGAVLAEAIGIRPTLWLLAIGYTLALVSLILARRSLPTRMTAPHS